MRSRGRLSGGSVGITSPSGTLSPRSPVSPDSKNKFFNGNFSPVHTRRRTQSEEAPKVIPDFAEFPIARRCPKLFSLKPDGEAHDMDTELADILVIESELNQFLTHCIDNQKKLLGELHYMDTGDYRSEDISMRLMPAYTLRSYDDIPPGPSAEADDEVGLDVVETNEEDEYENSCPTVNMPGKFWKFVSQYQAPIDETFLRNFYKEFVVPSFSDEMTKLCEVCNAERVPQTCKGNSGAINGKNSMPNSSPPADETQKNPLKRQLSTGKRPGRPPKAPRISEPTTDDLTTLLSNVVHCFRNDRNEEKNDERSKNGVMELNGINGKSPEQVRNGVLKDLDGKTKEIVASEDKFSDNFVKFPIIAAEYQHMMDQVVNIVNTSNSHNGVGKPLEKRSHHKKEPVDEASKQINGSSLGPQILTLLENFKRKLMTFISDMQENESSADTKVQESPPDINFNSQATNGHCSSVCKNEEFETEDDQDESVANGHGQSIKDSLSKELKRAKEELQETNNACKELVLKVWYRLLAEYLRSKIEAEMRETTKELNAVREKYYRDYPPKKPSNEREREECATTLRKHEKVVKAYFEH